MQLVFTVVWVLAFSAIIAYAPQYYWIIAIGFILAIIGFAVAKAIAEGRRTLASIREAPNRQPIIEIDEKEVKKLMEKDSEHLMKEQLEARKKAARLFLAFPLILVFAMAFPYVISLAGTNPQARFLVTAGFFTLWILATRPLFGGFRPVFPLIASGAKVYSDAVIIQMGRGMLGLRKPIKLKELRVVKERSFVELVMPDGRIIRLYSKNVDALAQALKQLTE